MGNLIDLALKLRPYIEKAAANLDDTDALEAIQLFPKWEVNITYEKDDGICINDNISSKVYYSTFYKEKRKYFIKNIICK